MDVQGTYKSNDTTAQESTYNVSICEMGTFASFIGT